MATEHDDLDDVFRAAGAERPDDDLIARVLADAAVVQAAPRPEPRKARRGWFAGAVSAIGGWGAASGITAAGVVGLALGFYAPDTVTAWIDDDLYFGGGYWLTPDLDALWVEDGDV